MGRRKLQWLSSIMLSKKENCYSLCVEGRRKCFFSHEGAKSIIEKSNLYGHYKLKAT